MQEEGIMLLPSPPQKGLELHHLFPSPKPFRNAWKWWQYSMMQNHIVTIQRHMKIDGIECGFKYFHNINAIELGTKAYTCIMGIFFSCCCSFFYMFLCCWYSYQSRLAFQLWVCEWGKGGTQVSSQPLTFQSWVLFLRKTCLEFQASTSNTHRKNNFLMGQGWSLRSFWRWFQTREFWNSMVRIHV